MSEKRKSYLNVRLTKTERDALEAISHIEGLRVSDCVRILIREGLRARGFEVLKLAGYMTAGVQHVEHSSN